MKKESFIFLSKEAKLKGTVETSQVILEGSIDGNITASDEVFLKNGSSVTGDILTKKIIVEKGYHHNGIIRMDTDDSRNKEKTAPPKKEHQEKKGHEKDQLEKNEIVSKDDSTHRLW